MPSEAKIKSHQLMLRAGMIKQSSTGIYSWLPLGFKVMKRIEQIVLIFIAAALAIPSYWFFWTLAGGGGYNKRIKPIPNPNNNYSKPFPKDLSEP